MSINLKPSGLECLKDVEGVYDDDLLIGTVDHKRKEVRPSHGYFYPNEMAKHTKKLAKDLGYSFNNN